jgi:GNAT superfamily N-acetyltransferase
MFSDFALSRRLELAEAMMNVSFVEARARVSPESGACWIQAGGAYAMFDGPDSPLTQTFGLGLEGLPTAEDLERIERFFGERSAPVFHEVSPVVDPAILGILHSRGYHPIELTTMLYRPLGATVLSDPSLAIHTPGMTVRCVAADEMNLYTETAARGWSEIPELGDFMREIGRVSALQADLYAFLVELAGAPIAAGALRVRDGVGMLAGASTVPEARGKGAQNALLAARLQYAADLGCDLAMMGAQPGSGSQRNAERGGFRIAYTRIKWLLAAKRA